MPEPCDRSKRRVITPQVTFVLSNLHDLAAINRGRSAGPHSSVFGKSGLSHLRIEQRTERISLFSACRRRLGKCVPEFSQNTKIAASAQSKSFRSLLSVGPLLHRNFRTPDAIAPRFQVDNVLHVA